MKVVHQNMEDKKAERREADRKRLVQSAFGEGQYPQRVASRTEGPSNTFLYHQGVALPRLARPVSAELPVDSIETGIIYMSRWAQDNTKIDDITSEGTENLASKADLEDKNTAPEPLEEGDGRDVGGSRDESNAKKIQAQQKCSLALLNMTMRDQVLRLLQGLDYR